MLLNNLKTTNKMKTTEEITYYKNCNVRNYLMRTDEKIIKYVHYYENGEKLIKYIQYDINNGLIYFYKKNGKEIFKIKQKNLVYIAVISASTLIISFLYFVAYLLV